jgi:hypothetical protein
MMSFKGFRHTSEENRLLLRAHDGRGWIAAPEITIHTIGTTVLEIGALPLAVI